MVYGGYAVTIVYHSSWFYKSTNVTQLGSPNAPNAQGSPWFTNASNASGNPRAPNVANHRGGLWNRVHHGCISGRKTGPGTPRPKGRPKPPDSMALYVCPKKILGSYFQAHGRKVSPSFSDVSISQTLSLRDSDLHHFQNSSMMQLQHMVAWRHFSDYQWISKKNTSCLVVH